MKAWLALAGLILVSVVAWPVAAQSGFAQAPSGDALDI